MTKQKAPEASVSAADVNPGASSALVPEVSQEPTSGSVSGEESAAAGAASGGTATSPIAAPDGLADDGREATLRVNGRDPELERTRAVKVETSGMFAHLYEDGRVIINDYDDEEDE